MGLADIFKKKTEKKENVQGLDSTQFTKNETLNKKISLRKQIVEQTVQKKSISSENARVVFVLDHSGSMVSLYKNGKVQDVLERMFPLAMHFDDNSEMEFYWFDTSFKELSPVNFKNIDNYVQNVILSKNDRFGGTYYAPVMQAILERYVRKNPMKIPTFVIFITDGNNADKSNAKDVLTTASRCNIFWKFVGIGNEKFEFLEKLDTMDGRFIDNANFIKVNDLSSLSDEALYDRLLDEYNDWLSLCRSHNISVDG